MTFDDVDNYYREDWVSRSLASHDACEKHIAKLERKLGEGRRERDRDRASAGRLAQALEGAIEALGSYPDGAIALALWREAHP